MRKSMEWWVVAFGFVGGSWLGFRKQSEVGTVERRKKE